MTAPDNGLEEALREALSTAASQVEPGDGGLERILVRTGGTAPRSWLASVTAEAFRRVRYWVWRGHWAWQDPGPWRARYRVLHGQVARRWGWARGTRASAWLAGAWARAASLAAGSPARDSLSLRSRGVIWMRLVAGLAAAACITAVAVADPPLRAALAQVSATVLAGGNQVLQPGVGGTGVRPSASTGTHGGSASGSVRALAGTFPSSARPGSASSPTPCLTPPASTATPRATASPSATRSSVAPTSVPPALSVTSAPGTGCSVGSGSAAPEPTVQSTPPSPAPTTQAAPTTAPTTAPPTTVPPTTAPPSTPPPTDSATPTPTASAAASTAAEGGPTGGTAPGGGASGSDDPRAGQ